MLGEDEKRAFDAMMDALDSSDSGSDSEAEAQSKVCVSPEVNAKFYKDAGEKNSQRTSLQSPDDQQEGMAERRDSYGGSPRCLQPASSAKNVHHNQSQAKGGSMHMDNGDSTAADMTPAAGGSTPTRAPPKPSRVINKRDDKDKDKDKDERVVELSRDPIKTDRNSFASHHHSSIHHGVRSPEFRGRYANPNQWSDGSSDDDEISSGKRFVLQRSTEGTLAIRSSLSSVNSSVEGVVARVAPAPSSTAREASMSDKIRLSEIDSFGNNNPRSQSHTPTDFSNGGSGTGTGSGSREGGEKAVNAGENKNNKNPNATLNADSIEATKQWLYRPCAKNARPLECYVQRERTGIAGSNTIFRLYNEQNVYTGQNSRFMMAAKKLKGKTTSYYLITLDMNPEDDRGSVSVLGRVRGNAVGSEYLFTDAGVTAGKTRLSSLVRKELGFVRFNFDSKGPSTTEAWVPDVTDGGAATVWQPAEAEEGMEAKIKGGKVDDLKVLRNKKPRWDAAHGGHVLNFHGRVTESSVKNFQLSLAGEGEDNQMEDDVILQFGKVEKDKFTLDFSWPLSPLQAFGICVASLDGKIADRKGYEFIKSTTNFLFGGSKEKRAGKP